MWEKTSAWAAKPHSIYHLFFSGANHYESRCKRFTWLPLGWLNWASVMAWDHSASVSESNCIHHDALESGVTLKFNYVIKGRWIGTEPDAAVWCACLKSKIYNGTGEVRCSVAEVQFRTSVQTWTFPNRTNSGSTSEEIPKLNPKFSSWFPWTWTCPNTFDPPILWHRFSVFYVWHCLLPSSSCLFCFCVWCLHSSVKLKPS